MSKSRLIAHVRSLQLEPTRKILQAHPSLRDVTNPRGRNLLHLACSASCTALRVPESVAARMVTFLLDSGLDVESTLVVDDYPCNAVWSAVARGRNATVVRLLVKRGGTPRGLFAAGWYGDLPMLRLLLKLGAVIDEYAEGATPFLYCWKSGRFEAAKLLVRQGADVNFQDAKGKTALHYGVERDFDPALLRFLVRHGASADLADRDGVSARQRASRKRDRRVAETIAHAERRGSGT